MKFLVNPSKFNKVADYLFLPVLISSIILFSIGLIFAFYLSPDDYQQGSTVRIMYVHVPSAWLALLTYAIMTLYSIAGLAFRIPFGFIVNARVSKLSATSIKEISSPTAGFDGNVTVIALLVVSINNFCPLNAFAVEAVIADVDHPELVVCRGYQFVPSVARRILLPGAISIVLPDAPNRIVIVPFKVPSFIINCILSTAIV